MALAPLHERWVEVFSGPFAIASLHAQELRDAGIPTFIPDTHLKELDAPAALGGYLFYWQVMVPREEEARAREVLAPKS